MASEAINPEWLLSAQLRYSKFDITKSMNCQGHKSLNFSLGPEI